MLILSRSLGRESVVFEQLVAASKPHLRDEPRRRVKSLFALGVLLAWYIHRCFCVL